MATDTEEKRETHHDQKASARMTQSGLISSYWLLSMAKIDEIRFAEAFMMCSMGHDPKLASQPFTRERIFWLIDLFNRIQKG